MDKDKIQNIMLMAFKTLTVSQVEIVMLSKPLLKVRIVAEGYASKNIPERIKILSEKLRAYSPELSINYAISFEPLTPAEFNEHYNNKTDKNSNSNSGEKIAAKSLDL